MDLVSCSFADLRPFDLIVQMAGLTYFFVEMGMGWNLFDVGGCPAPRHTSSILKILLMADMTIYILVRTFAPSLPCGLHDVTGATETGIIFDIIIKMVAA